MANRSSISLVPLCVPAGWKVDHNSFFAINISEDSEYTQKTAKYLVEDLIYIHSYHIDQARNQTFHLDLGWYPDMDLSGQYRLTIAEGDSSDILETFLSRIYEEVASKIDFWLNKLQAQNNQNLEFHKIIPLRITSGWFVQINELTDEKTAHKSPTDRTILLLTKEYPSGSFISISLKEIYHASSNTFSLTISRDKQDIPIKTHECNTKEETIPIIEQWMEISHNIGVSSPKAELLAPDYRA